MVDEFVGVFQQVCHYTDYEWLQLCHLQISLSFSRFKAGLHEKCIEWAPQAFFTGDIANNLEPKLVRASKIKCSVCGLKGAALGCLVKSCRKSYHVPCAHKIPGCRWDEENFVMLCPSHSLKKLPCERLKSKKKTKLQQPSSDMMHDNLNSPSPMQRDEIWISPQWS
ncbi:BRCA1-associated RING domain protein 1-like [Phragmites australis]|uniref:BRCA1-associated RING domain protein 1-like n=1 Tax=Phragmites australis TaxID=29695 RepID=UPI002D786AE9|nr:BRCA1-associated RING domain protein 1-like [Phragmites australis]